MDKPRLPKQDSFAFVRPEPTVALTYRASVPMHRWLHRRSHETGQTIQDIIDSALKAARGQLAMAQRAKSTARKTTPATVRPRDRPPGSTLKKPAAATAAAGKASKVAAAKPAAGQRKLSAASASVVPKLSKQELRDQAEKLERTVAMLRARSRDAVRAAKQAAARIEELEAQLAAKEQGASEAPIHAAATTKPARRAAAAPAAKPRRGRPRSDERDPGDAVPPGVAVEAPEPMDQEAAAAFESLEEKLRTAD